MSKNKKPTTKKSTICIGLCRIQGNNIREYGRFYHSSPRYQHRFDELFRPSWNQVLKDLRAFTEYATSLSKRAPIPTRRYPA
ncbi:MAG: hypothetical protein AABX66_04155 [Nanoarchaeota archaeon]